MWVVEGARYVAATTSCINFEIHTYTCNNFLIFLESHFYQVPVLSTYLVLYTATGPVYGYGTTPHHIHIHSTAQVPGTYLLINIPL